MAASSSFRSRRARHERGRRRSSAPGRPLVRHVQGALLDGPVVDILLERADRILGADGGRDCKRVLTDAEIDLLLAGRGGDRVMAIPKAKTREALNLLSPDILRLGPHLHAQFKAELAELREDDMLGMVALFEKWSDMLSMYFRASVKKGHS